MRKAQKKQAEDFVQLLSDAHQEIRRNLEKQKEEAAMDLLEQCQQGAVQLGTLIEKTEGEDFVTIGILEEYCELVYQIHDQIARGESISSGKVFKNLRRMWIQIENSIKNDIPERLEVVFLPYKAAMWDSLESVWMAADADENCDAYVIPIPYFDKSPNGGFLEMHYEGDQYPEYVPVVNYESYPFEERHPDMIFIHNPYDEMNFVTSVHPFFYSKNLKRFTDKLVYIPYFILDEIDPNNKEAQKGIEHFCTAPGVVNADQVIVQSEDMRQVYINVLLEATEDNAVNRAYWEKKILGIGSPKLDKLHNTKKENLEVPAEWKRVIQKPDGSYKKIILYNTGLVALLEQGDKMLAKMQNVFQIFRRCQDDTALLWRPHPLIPATIGSMRPQLGEEYQRIVEQYRREGWGIYDDSSDLDRAIILSDAYYGDHSSLVQLCQKAGKPVMIQNVDILDDVE
ncbi:MAG: hypothetical protein HFH53_11775 [Hespellia sp.]|nr:hypothetical protein [Hespellia sp.]